MTPGASAALDAPLESSLDKLYRKRFPEAMRDRRNAIWKILCDDWFGRYVPPTGRVLEIAAGYCEFINNVRAAAKVVVDLNPETKQHAAPGIVVHEAAAENLNSVVEDGSCDAVFMSNFLEHCRTRDQILTVLRASARALKPGGRILILGPNFRYCYKVYFDYFDHHLPLSEWAVVEALELAGFEVEEVQPKTLPFSFRGSLPSWPWLVKLYLKMPFVWRFFGAQFFVVARPTA